MGAFHPEIDIRKSGVRRLVKHTRIPKKKQTGRAADEMTVITIRSMPVGPVAGGMVVVRSCNTFTPTLGSGWSKLAKARVEKRLRDSDGGKKGRVLFAELQCVNAAPVVVAAMCLHIERSDELEISSFEITTDLVTHREKLFDAMLIAVERIACEHNKGRPATVLINVSKDDASWYRDHFDFKQHHDHPYGKNRRILGRQTRHESCRPRKEKRRKPQAAQAQETRTR